jgi:hypothetical protein
METWIFAALALLLNVGVAYGAGRYASGRKDKEIEDLRREVDELKTRTALQATKPDVDRLLARLDEWANKIETDMRGVRLLLAQIVSGEKPALSAILGGR